MNLLELLVNEDLLDNYFYFAMRDDLPGMIQVVDLAIRQYTHRVTSLREMCERIRKVA
jgi:hypothetical protein